MLFLGLYGGIRGLVQKQGAARSLPVVVWVDSEKRVVNTSSTSAEQVLKDGAITVYPEDKISSELIIDPVTDWGAGQKIVLQRAPQYFIEVDGRTIEIRGWDNSVSSIIQKSEIALGAKDLISPALDKTLVPGTAVVITRINEADIDILEGIAFETIQKADPSIPFGTKNITQAGVNGQIRKTYRIRYRNGVEVSRALISRETIASAVSKVVVSGSISGKAKWGAYYESNYGPYTTAFHYSGYTGKYLLVTNVANGKSVRVKIVDLGPTNGLLDLSTTALEEIGAMGSVNFVGYATVMVQLVD